jgi:hypothetical protein
MEREDWEVELEKRKIKQQELVTEVKKDKFIDDIKKGLGERIKEEPNKIQKKPGFLTKLKRIFS